MPQKLKIFLLSLLIACLLAPWKLEFISTSTTLQTLILFTIAAVTGPKIGFLVALAYLALGAMGLPIFGGHSAGLEKLYGPSAGFLWGFPLLAWYVGWESHRASQNFITLIFTFFKAHLLLFIPGFTVLYLALPQLDLWQTSLGLIPGLFLKCIVGGILSAYLLRLLPPEKSTA